MTNLQIGTILIAKEDIGNNITKGKKYRINKMEHEKDGQYYCINVDNGESYKMTKSFIEDYFTIKRYTLTDLKEKKIAVKLTKKDDFYKICDLLGYVPNSGDYSFTEYHAVDEDNEFVWCSVEWINENNYTLIPSIDLIDLEMKEEVKETYTCKYCGAEFSKDVDEEDCYANPNRKPDTPTSSTIVELESEIARLKGELEKSQEAGKCIAEKLADEMKEKVSYMEEVNRLKGENMLLSERKETLRGEFNRLGRENKGLKSDLNIVFSQMQILQLKESTPDLTKRERMAWELFMKYEHLEIDRAFELTDTFLAKSKEVGNGN